MSDERQAIEFSATHPDGRVPDIELPAVPPITKVNGKLVPPNRDEVTFIEVPGPNGETLRFVGGFNPEAVLRALQKSE